MVVWLLFALLPIAAHADSSAEIIRYLGTNGGFGECALFLYCPNEGAKCTLREANNGRAVATKEIPLADGKKILDDFSASAGEIEIYEGNNPALHWNIVIGKKEFGGQASRYPSRNAKGPKILMKLELELKGKLR